MCVLTYLLDLEALLVALAVLPGFALGLRSSGRINIHVVGHDDS